MTTTISIQYFGQNLRPYWNRSGDVTIESQFAAAEKDRKKLVDRCYDFDLQLMNDGIKAGGKKYADLLALAYRQAIAAHKLVEGRTASSSTSPKRTTATVPSVLSTSPILQHRCSSITIPSSPKATMNFIYDYSESGRWDKAFRSSDVGTYPKANGQTYGATCPWKKAET